MPEDSTASIYRAAPRTITSELMVFARAISGLWKRALEHEGSECEPEAESALHLDSNTLASLKKAQSLWQATSVF